MNHRARTVQGLIITATAAAVLLLGTTMLRADAPDGRFTTVAAGIQDSVTGLVWQQPASATKIFGGNIAAACTAPFRAPTIQELFTLLDVRRTAVPLIDPIFTGADNSSYWSATAEIGGTGHWAVDFANGGTTAPDDSAQLLIRCVQ